MYSVRDGLARVEALGELSVFRLDLYDALAARADALFDLVDAMLCVDGPVKSLVELSLAAEHQRGHGALYDALGAGRIEIRRLRAAVAALALPRAADGRIVLGVDVSNWLRPDAATSPDRLFCHVYGRGRSADQFIPGWPYSFVAALESGRTSWTAILDPVRLGPADDVAEVTATQLRDVVERLVTAGHWHQGDPQIWIVADAGYDLPRLAFVLADLPVVIVGRLRSDRVFYCPRRPRHPARAAGGPSMATSSPWPGPRPGPHRRTRRARTPPVTAPPPPQAGTGCTRN